MERVYKNTNFIFKLLPCLLITMFTFMCLFGSYVFAFSYNGNEIVEYNNDISNKSVTEDFKYFLYCNDSNGHIFVRISTNTFIKDDALHEPYYTEAPTCYTYEYNSEGQKWFWSSTSSNASDGKLRFDVYNILFTNFDLYDTNGDLVFQAPPQQVEAQGIVATQTQGIQMDKILQEIIQILPVVLVVLVGIIAIRKAIVMIRAFLQKS